MRKSLIAIVFGTTGLIVGLLIANMKVNGQWFFTKRRIDNEGNARWQYKGGVNPAW